jgi:hypothetical protein
MTAAALPQSQEPYEVPEGGLASFLTATVGDWSDEALNSDNYYDIVKPTAEQLAAFGREEDDRIAHVATGETVIPMAVFEEDPALKEALFARMRDMGIEPERYVVGNELNSINPVTGQPEFFLKKLFKGIKKAVKGVVKVFKKLAPIVLSVGLSFIPGVGPILAGTLGSGIGTLIQGGSLKDAFKSALIGGAVAGIGSGISNVVKAQIPGGSAGGTFMEGVQGALPDIDKIQSTFTNAGSSGLTAEQAQALSKTADAQITQNEALKAAGVKDATLTNVSAPAAPENIILSDIDRTGFKAMLPGSNEALMADEVLGIPAPASGITPKPPVAPSIGPQGGFKGAEVAATTPFDEATRLASGQAGPPATTAITSAAPGTITEAMRQAVDPGFFASMKKFFTTGDLGALKQAFLPGTSKDVIIEKLQKAGFTVSEEIADDIAEKLAPTLIRKAAPLGIAGLIAADAGGMFDVPPMGELPDAFGGMTGAKLLSMYPEKYGLAQPGQFYQPPTYAANGGDIQHFPRKNGAIYGPGTETSDDIPAMLSDGEFVMTARAVRGAGNGSREAGMRRMYDIMRKFEGGAARGN